MKYFKKSTFWQKKVDFFNTYIVTKTVIFLCNYVILGALLCYHVIYKSLLMFTAELI